MELIVCYQYEIGDFEGKFPPITHFAKSMDDVFKKYALGINVYCKAVAGWKVKNYYTNFQFVVPEGSFFAQDKPLHEFLNSKKQP